MAMIATGSVAAISVPKTSAEDSGSLRSMSSACRSQKSRRRPRRAIAESPDKLQARLALSKFEGESGDYEAAVAVLSEAKTTFGNNAEFLTELAGLYNRMGDFENTMTALEDAERLMNLSLAAQIEYLLSASGITQRDATEESDVRRRGKLRRR